ncbi:MAG: bifunctional phosphopantothenoylcysteine decarboxylase/phosphopantothenate--cysteine ligase CoaBC [Oscillospiraceae bacterium]|nr:bifunctional phosphopantothenoylcysteine decarboxylase/phosphopantothenate--cysteine ligase CoaBC [Oscillospiraceae bacterium]
MSHKKTVLLGVTGGIAAYKIPNLCSILVKKGYNVETILTENAQKIVSPIPFESLSGNRCHVDTFDPMDTSKVEHIALAQQADILVIAPASANILAKLRYGLADDMLSTTALACTCKTILVPAMNTNMYENPATQENLSVLRDRGFIIMEPASGRLACGAVGTGKMPEPSDIFDRIEAEIACQKDLTGLRVLVTAGPTQEPIDPVRYITNHSSGKMGYAIAHAAMLRGADVVLVSGQTALKHPPLVKTIPIVTAQDMFEAVTREAENADIIIKAAAVADYTPTETADNKIKKTDGDMSIPLKRTQDILGYLGTHRKPGQFLCGFSMETQNMLENSRKKLTKKNLDMVVANNLKVEGAGFQGNTNCITLITANDTTELPMMDKEEAAHEILSKILTMRG